MFTIEIQIDDGGTYIDFNLVNPPEHIPIHVKEVIIDDVNTEFEEE